MSDASLSTLLRLVKDGHVAEARVRPIEGIGIELRYNWENELRVSQMFKSWEALEQPEHEPYHDQRAAWALSANDMSTPSERSPA